MVDLLVFRISVKAYWNPYLWAFPVFPSSFLPAIIIAANESSPIMVRKRSTFILASFREPLTRPNAESRQQEISLRSYLTPGEYEHPEFMALGHYSGLE